MISFFIGRYSRTAPPELHCRHIPADNVLSVVFSVLRNSKQRDRGYNDHGSNTYYHNNRCIAFFLTRLFSAGGRSIGGCFRVFRRRYGCLCIIVNKTERRIASVSNRRNLGGGVCAVRRIIDRLVSTAPEVHIVHVQIGIVVPFYPEVQRCVDKPL